MTTRQIILAKRPEGTPGKDDFTTRETDLPKPSADEVLLEGWYYSVDPYMRGRMSTAKSYAPPYETGQPITGAVVARVLESQSAAFSPGDVVTGNMPWQERMILPAKQLRKIDDKVAPASYYLGILGMTGLTAYFGLLHIGKPKAGEMVVVSGAAGAVGLVVGQIAKLKGCQVVGIAGSQEKIESLKNEYGFNEAINYKTTDDMDKAIAQACPDGVDIYFDNVGGSISDAVINHLNFHARVPLCGQISLYNSKETPMGPRLQPLLLKRSVLMQGFIIGNFQADFEEGRKQLAAWVQAGKLKFAETIINGFEKLPEAFLGLFTGENSGKMIVKA